MPAGVKPWHIVPAKWNIRHLRGGENGLTGKEFLGSGSLILKCSVRREVSNLFSNIVSPFKGKISNFDSYILEKINLGKCKISCSDSLV